MREFGAAFTDSIGPITNSRESAEALGESLAGIVKTGITPIANGFKVMNEFVVEAVDAIAFGFRNASDLASLAMIDLSLAVYDLIPGTETVVEHVAGTLVALWDASAAAGDAFVQNVIGGFTEIKNVAAAVWEAIVAGMDAILAGENPLEAITQGFLDTLASQENAVSGGNPLTAFADTFKATRANVQLGFEEHGLADSLREERERIEQSIAANERAFQAGSDTIAQGITAGVMDATEGAAEVGKLQPLEGPGALQRGSSDAFSAVLSAMRGERNDPAAESVKVQKDMLAEQKRATNELRKQSKATPVELIAGTI